jgi:acetolactate synthase-1/3 small subunit
MYQNQDWRISFFIIVVNTTEKWVQNIVGQIEKQVEVIKAFYYIGWWNIFLEKCCKTNRVFYLMKNKFKILSKESKSQK